MRTWQGLPVLRTDRLEDPPGPRGWWPHRGAPSWGEKMFVMKRVYHASHASSTLPQAVRGQPSSVSFLLELWRLRGLEKCKFLCYQGGVVIHATRDFTVKTVQKAADLAMQAGSKLYTDSASSYRLITGYEHDAVNHTKKEYARGDVHENRAECLFSLLKPYLRVFRGISKTNLSGYVGFFQFLRNFRQLTAFEQAEMILYAALDPAVASRARRGDFVRCLDHFKLLQSPIN